MNKGKDEILNVLRLNMGQLAANPLFLFASNCV